MILLLLLLLSSMPRDYSRNLNMNRLQKLLIKHEGFVNKTYEIGGLMHIGVGRNLDDMGLSDDEVLYLLDNDIVRCDKELLHNFKWYADLSRARQDAMINLCFNLGTPRLMTFSKALAAMESKDYQEAAIQFLDSLWAKQVGPNRSNDLAYMIRTGKYITE